MSSPDAVTRQEAPVLCAVDGGDAGVAAGRLAASIARRLGAPLTLLHAIPAGPPLMELASVHRIPPPHEERETLMRERAQRLLAGVARDIGAPTARLVVDHGRPEECILRRADGDGAQLVVTGTGRRGLASSVLLGSVSSGVMRGARRPVLLVPADHRPSRTDAPIIAAVDDNALAGRVVAAAVQLADGLGVEPILLHVAVPELDAVTFAGAVPLEGGDGETERLVADRVAEELAPDRTLETVQRRGFAADEILGLARQRGASLVVVGARRLGPVRSTLLGSVSAALLDAGEVALVAVTEETEL